MFLLSLFPLVNWVEVFFPFYPFSLGDFYLLPMDFVYFLTILYLTRCAFVRPKWFASVLKENVFLTLFLAVVALYIVFYTPVYGQSAVGEARKFYAVFLFPILALVSIKRPEDLRRLILVVIFVATCVAVVALGLAATQGSIVRVINAEGTLILALAAFSLLLHRIYRIIVISPILDHLLLLLFSLLVVASGQRSVWLAVGLGVMLAMWLYRDRSSVIAKSAALGVLIVAGLTVALAMFPETGASIIDHFTGIIDPYSDDTGAWRIEGWRQQLGALSTEGLLFGEGLGSYYRWQFDGQGKPITASPHNAFVQLVLKFGLFGLMIYGLVAFEFFRKTLAVRKRLAAGPMKSYVEMGILNFGAAHAYILGYGFAPIMLIFFAVAMSAAKLSQGDLRRLPKNQRTVPLRLAPHRASVPRPNFGPGRYRILHRPNTCAH